MSDYKDLCAKLRKNPDCEEVYYALCEFSDCECEPSESRCQRCEAIGAAERCEILMKDAASAIEGLANRVATDSELRAVEIRLGNRAQAFVALADEMYRHIVSLDVDASLDQLMWRQHYEDARVTA